MDIIVRELENVRSLLSEETKKKFQKEMLGLLYYTLEMEISLITEKMSPSMSAGEQIEFCARKQLLTDYARELVPLMLNLRR